MDALVKLYIKKGIKASLITSGVVIFVMFMIVFKFSSFDKETAQFFFKVFMPLFSMCIVFIYMNALYEVVYSETKEGISEMFACSPLNYRKIILLRAFIFGGMSWFMTAVIILIFFWNYLFKSSYLVFFTLLLLPFFSISLGVFMIIIITLFIEYDIRIKNVMTTLLIFIIVYSVVGFVKIVMKYHLSLKYFYILNSALAIFFFLLSLIALRFLKKSLFLGK